MAYRMAVYLFSKAEDVTREATRLVVEPMKNFDIYTIRNGRFYSLRLFLGYALDCCTRWLKRLNGLLRCNLLNNILSHKPMTVYIMVLTYKTVHANTMRKILHGSSHVK